MARKRDPGMSVNLFPFLSILVCIIGCLTMIIVVLNLTQMNKAEGKTEEEITIAQEYMAIKKQQDEDRKELEKLKLLIEDMIQVNRDTNANFERLQKLKEMKENQEKLDEDRNELIAQINALMAAIKELDKDYPNITKKIEELLAELKKRDLPPDPPKLRVRPSGSGANRPSFFVEAGTDALLIHESLSEDPEVIPLSALNQNKKFVDFLKKVGASKNNRLIFLIRSSKSSTNSYLSAVKVISAFNAENNTEIVPGRLPLPGEGKVDLTQFAQYLRP